MCDGLPGPVHLFSSQEKVAQGPGLREDSSEPPSQRRKKNKVRTLGVSERDV